MDTLYLVVALHLGQGSRSAISLYNLSAYVSPTEILICIPEVLKILSLAPETITNFRNLGRKSCPHSPR